VSNPAHSPPRGDHAALASSEVNVSCVIAPRGGSPARTFIARSRGLVRLAALAAVLAMAIHPSATIAAELGSDADQGDVTAVLARSALSAIDCGGNAAGHGFDVDDGEDQFDEGDDEYERACPNVDDGEDWCVDDAQDHVDEGDDEYEGSDADESACANVNDAEDRRLDDGEDHVDEGDDEFDARSEPIDARPSATSAATALDLSAPGAAAAVIGLGAGGAWLLRRARR
jgi:hypothetical protein